MSDMPAANTMSADLVMAMIDESKPMKPECSPVVEDPLTKAVAAALDPAKLQGIVEEEVSKAVRKWVDSALTGYNSPIKTAFGDRMAQMVVPAIERLSLDNARLDVLLTSLVEQSVFGERAAMLENFGKLVTGEKRDMVPASELFAEWKRMVAYDFDCCGRDVVTGDGEPYYEPIECLCDLEMSEESWGGMRNASLKFIILSEDEDQRDEFSRSISLYRWTNLPVEDDLWYVSYPPQPTLKSIARMSSFDVLLARMDTCGTKVFWDFGPMSGAHDEIEPESKPEPDWG